MSSASEHRRRIVIGFDGSKAAVAAMRWAFDEALRRDALLEAVIAWRPSAMLAAGAARPGASARSSEEQRDAALALVERELRPLLAGSDRPQDLAAEVRAVRGAPHRVLLEASMRAELLVIGGRSGRLSGTLPWSTGQQLVRESRCPVVVVPSP